MVEESKRFTVIEIWMRLDVRVILSHGVGRVLFAMARLVEVRLVKEVSHNAIGARKAPMQNILRGRKGKHDVVYKHKNEIPTRLARLLTP